MDHQRMGFLACIIDYARNCDGQNRGHDPRQTPKRHRGDKPWLFRGLIACLLTLFFVQPGPTKAETLRVAIYNIELSRKGPGLLLREILSDDAPQIAAATEVLTRLKADILVLANFDYDYDLITLSAFADRLKAAGSAYPYRFALRPNTGLATALDLDGDGRRGGPGDAQGFGYFSGQGGLAILSRLPIETAAVRDFSGFLWRDLPGALLPDGMDDARREAQRLSTTAHWDVPVTLPNGRRLHLLVWHATPPVFDGPDDRNGRRNHDEAAFWLRFLAGDLPFKPPDAPYILLGDANLDPVKGDGRPAALDALLSHPGLRDPHPLRHVGNDTVPYTAWFDQTGGLRVEYLLPSADLSILASAIAGPDETPDDTALYATASRHFPVWLDIALPDASLRAP
jgi:hypothetical protein